MTRFLTALALLSVCTGSLLAQAPEDCSKTSSPLTWRDTPSSGASWSHSSPWADMETVGGDGENPSVSMTPSNLVVVVDSEADNIHYNDGLRYRIGKLDLVSGTVNWSSPHFFLENGLAFSPSVALTKEGYVIISYREESQLKYFVGTLDPNGG